MYKNGIKSKVDNTSSNLRKLVRTHKNIIKTDWNNGIYCAKC